MNTTIKTKQTTKEIILFKLQYFVMMLNCGRDEEAKETLKEAFKIIEDAEIK